LLVQGKKCQLNVRGVWFGGVFLSEAGLDLTAADGGKWGTAGLISSLSSALKQHIMYLGGKKHGRLEGYINPSWLGTAW
jgi:hypothetical protein